MHNDLKCRKAHKFVHPPNRPPSHGILDPGIAVTIGQGASICEAVPNTTPTFQTFRKTIPKTKSTFQNFRGTVFQYFYSRPWASALRSKHTILFFVVITHLSSREFCAPTHSNLSSYRMLGNNQFQTVAPPSASGVDLLLRNYAAICCFFSLGGLAAMFFQQIFRRIHWIIGRWMGSVGAESRSRHRFVFASCAWRYSSACIPFERTLDWMYYLCIFGPWNARRDHGAESVPSVAIGELQCSRIV
jgi:hypothetical protein